MWCEISSLGESGLERLHAQGLCSKPAEDCNRFANTAYLIYLVKRIVVFSSFLQNVIICRAKCIYSQSMGNVAHAYKTRVPLREPYLVLVFQLITGEKPHFLSH